MNLRCDWRAAVGATPPPGEAAAANSRLAVYASKRLLVLVWSTSTTTPESEASASKEEAAILATNTAQHAEPSTHAAARGPSGSAVPHEKYFLLLFHKQRTFQQQQQLLLLQCMQQLEQQQQQHAFYPPSMEVVGNEEMRRRYLHDSEKNCFLRYLAEFCAAIDDPLELLMSEAHGVLGLLPLVRGFSLCVAKEAVEEESFLGIHKIFRVQETKLVPLFTTAPLPPSFRVYVRRVLRAAAAAITSTATSSCCPVSSAPTEAANTRPTIRMESSLSRVRGLYVNKQDESEAKEGTAADRGDICGTVGAGPRTYTAARHKGDAAEAQAAPEEEEEAGAAAFTYTILPEADVQHTGKGAEREVPKAYEKVTERTPPSLQREDAGERKPTAEGRRVALEEYEGRGERTVNTEECEDRGERTTHGESTATAEENPRKRIATPEKDKAERTGTAEDIRHKIATLEESTGERTGTATKAGIGGERVGAAVGEVNLREWTAIAEADVEGRTETAEQSNVEERVATVGAQDAGIVRTSLALEDLRRTTTTAAAAAVRDFQAWEQYYSTRGEGKSAHVAAAAADARYEQLLKAFPLEWGCYFCKSFFLCLPLQQLAARRAIQLSSATLSAVHNTKRAYVSEPPCSCYNTEATDPEHGGCTSHSSSIPLCGSRRCSRWCPSAPATGGASSPSTTYFTDFLNCSELKAEEGGPLRREESRFVWNYQLLKKHADAESREASIESLRRGLLLPLLHGSIQAAAFVTPHAVVRLLLIARRSAFFAGTRYRKRGLSSAGDAANEVETEFILYSYCLKAPFLRRALPSAAQRYQDMRSGVSDRSSRRGRRSSSDSGAFCNVGSSGTQTEATAPADCHTGCCREERVRAAEGMAIWQQRQQEQQVRRQARGRPAEENKDAKEEEEDEEQQQQRLCESAEVCVGGQPHRESALHMTSQGEQRYYPQEQQQQQECRYRERQHQQQHMTSGLSKQQGRKQKQQQQEAQYVMEFPLQFILFSHVQLRGSVPLFWSQEASMLPAMPPLAYTQTDVNYTATRRHCSSLFQRYGAPIYLFNLLRHVTPASGPEPSSSGLGCGQQQQQEQQSRLFLSRSCSGVSAHHRGTANSNSTADLPPPFKRSISASWSEATRLGMNSRQKSAVAACPLPVTVRTGVGCRAAAAAAPERSVDVPARGVAAADSGSSSKLSNGGSRPAAVAAAAGAAVAAAAGAAAAAGRAGVRAAAAAGGGGERREEQESELGYLYSAAVQQLNQELPKELQLHFCWVDLRRVPRAREAAVREEDTTGSSEGFPTPPSSVSSSTWPAASAACTSATTSNNEDAEAPYSRLRRLGFEMLESVGYFSTNDPITWQATALQLGVCRVNCLDCLDRTNEAQHVLHQQLLLVLLRRLRLLPATVNQLDPQVSSLLASLMDEMGDRLAMQYGGSNAHKKQHALRTDGCVTSTGEEAAAFEGYSSSLHCANMCEEERNSEAVVTEEPALETPVRGETATGGGWRKSLASFFSDCSSYPSLAAAAAGVSRSHFTAAAEFIWQRALQGRWLLEDGDGSKKKHCLERLFSSPLLFLSLSTSVKRRYNNVLADRSKQQALNLLHQRFLPFDLVRRREAAPPLWEVGGDAWCHHDVLLLGSPALACAHRSLDVSASQSTRNRRDARTVFDPGSWWVLPLQRFFNACRLAVVVKRVVSGACCRLCSSSYSSCRCDNASTCVWCPCTPSCKRNGMLLHAADTCCTCECRTLGSMKEQCSSNVCHALAETREASRPYGVNNILHAPPANEMGPGIDFATAAAPECTRAAAGLLTATALAEPRERGEQLGTTNIAQSLKAQRSRPHLTVSPLAVEKAPSKAFPVLVASASHLCLPLGNGSSCREPQGSASFAPWLQLFGGHPACVPPPILAQLMHATHVSEDARSRPCQYSCVKSTPGCEDAYAVRCCTMCCPCSTEEHVGASGTSRSAAHIGGSCSCYVSPDRIESYLKTGSCACSCGCRWPSQVQPISLRFDALRDHVIGDAFTLSAIESTYTYEPWREDVDREAAELAAKAVALLRDTLQKYSFGGQLQNLDDSVHNFLAAKDASPQAHWLEGECVNRVASLNSVDRSVAKGVFPTAQDVRQLAMDAGAFCRRQNIHKSLMRCCLAEMFLPLFIQPLCIAGYLYSDKTYSTGASATGQPSYGVSACHRSPWREEEKNSFQYSSCRNTFKSGSDTGGSGTSCYGVHGEIRDVKSKDLVTRAYAELNSNRGRNAGLPYLSFHEVENLYDGERVLSYLLTAAVFVRSFCRLAAQARRPSPSFVYCMPIGERRQRSIADRGTGYEESIMWLLSPSTLLRVPSPSAPPAYSPRRVAALYRRRLFRCSLPGSFSYVNHGVLKPPCSADHTSLRICECRSACNGKDQECLPSFAQTAAALVWMQISATKKTRISLPVTTHVQSSCGRNQIKLWSKERSLHSDVSETFCIGPAPPMPVFRPLSGNVKLSRASVLVLRDGNFAPYGTSLIEEKTLSVLPMRPPWDVSSAATVVPLRRAVPEPADPDSAGCSVAEWGHTGVGKGFSLKSPGHPRGAATADPMYVDMVPPVLPEHTIFVEQLLQQEDELLPYLEVQQLDLSGLEETLWKNAGPDTGRAGIEAMLFPVNLPLFYLGC